MRHLHVGTFFMRVPISRFQMKKKKYFSKFTSLIVSTILLLTMCFLFSYDICKYIYLCIIDNRKKKDASKNTFMKRMAKRVNVPSSSSNSITNTATNSRNHLVYPDLPQHQIADIEEFASTAASGKVLLPTTKDSEGRTGALVEDS